MLTAAASPSLGLSATSRKLQSSDLTYWVSGSFRGDAHKPKLRGDVPCLLLNVNALAAPNREDFLVL